MKYRMSVPANVCIDVIADDESSLAEATNEAIEQLLTDEIGVSLQSGEADLGARLYFNPKNSSAFTAEELDIEDSWDEDEDAEDDDDDWDDDDDSVIEDDEDEEDENDDWEEIEEIIEDDTEDDVEDDEDDDDEDDDWDDEDEDDDWDEGDGAW